MLNLVDILHGVLEVQVLVQQGLWVGLPLGAMVHSSA
jgi:hypothetical protein